MCVFLIKFLVGMSLFFFVFCFLNDTLFLVTQPHGNVYVPKKEQIHPACQSVSNGDRVNLTISEGPSKQRGSDITHVRKGERCIRQSDSLLHPPRPMGIALAQVAAPIISESQISLPAETELFLWKEKSEC